MYCCIQRYFGKKYNYFGQKIKIEKEAFREIPFQLSMEQK